MPINTININEGDLAYIPSGATILNIVNPSSLSVISPNDCVDLTVAPRVCWQFVIDRVDGGSNWDDANLTAVTMGGITYNFSTIQIYNASSSDISNQINLAVPFGLYTVVSLEGNAVNNNKKVIVFSTPSTITTPPTITISNFAGGDDTAIYHIVAQTTTCPLT